ncbi:hypothetical protein [Streptomyces violens]|uniref:hypothetical protein n=1 Tax=Streptomyces violens TaxID=66377 RepID=UPI0012FF37FF|nr:hypothetical protein [Streptomyces violens]
MRKSIGITAPLAALALLTACGGADGNTHPCTLMDAPAGIHVKVHPELANRTADATLTACWDDTCRKRTVQLREITRPEEPATNWPGFATVRDLPGKPVRVTLVLKNQRDTTLLDQQVSVTPKPTYPNGRNCSPAGHQARVTVTEKGSLIPR